MTAVTMPVALDNAIKPAMATAVEVEKKSTKKPKAIRQVTKTRNQKLHNLRILIICLTYRLLGEL